MCIGHRIDIGNRHLAPAFFVEPRDHGNTQLLDQVRPASGQGDNALDYLGVRPEYAFDRLPDQVPGFLLVKGPDLDSSKKLYQGLPSRSQRFLISTPETTATMFSAKFFMNRLRSR